MITQYRQKSKAKKKIALVQHVCIVSTLVTVTFPVQRHVLLYVGNGSKCLTLDFGGMCSDVSHIYIAIVSLIVLIAEQSLLV